MRYTVLLLKRKKILASTDAQEKVKLQASYDEMFHHYWHEPQFSQPDRGSSWLKPLRQCRHFGSFDIDFYDESGPRSSIALEILRNAMKERFTVWVLAHTHSCSTLVKKRRI
jgi:hypothetical protein